MNIIVEQTPLADHLGHAAWRAPVGLVKWQGMEPYWSLIVKFAYRYDSQAGTVALLNEPFDLQLAVPSTLPGANREDLAYASDFIFSKLGAEILLTGHAHSADGKEATPAGIRLVHGDEILCERSFRVVADSSSGRLPLSSGSLRELETDEPAGAVGPCTHTPPDTKNRPLEDVDFSAYCSGHPKQRVEFLPPDAALELFGLSATAAHFRLALPRLHPRAILETREYNHVGVELDCDTLWIDTDRELLVTVWRGLIPIASDDGSAFRRILLGIEDIDEPRTNEQAMASLLHGPLSLAVTEESLRNPEAHAASGRAVLEAARMQRRQYPPERRLSLQAYAEVAAHVAEGEPHRSRALTAHNLDGLGWAQEERAWLHAISEDARKGPDGEDLALQFSAAFQAAQDALGPDEPARDLNTYVAMRVAIESQGDPSRTLAQHHMTLAAWMRLDRAWSRKGKDDPTCGQQIRDGLNNERARLHAASTPPKPAQTTAKPPLTVRSEDRP